MDLNLIIDRAIDNVVDGIVLETFTPGNPYAVGAGQLSQEASAQLDKIAQLLNDIQIKNPRELIQRAWNSFAEESGVIDGSHRSDDKVKARHSRSARRKMFDKHFGKIKNHIENHILNIFKNKYGVTSLNPDSIQGDNPESAALRARVDKAQKFLNNILQTYNDMVGFGPSHSPDQVREIVISSAFNYPRSTKSKLPIDKDNPEYQKWSIVVNSYNNSLGELYKSSGYELENGTIISFENIIALRLISPRIFGDNKASITDKADAMYKSILSVLSKRVEKIDPGNDELSENALREQLYSEYGISSLSNYLYGVFDKIVNKHVGVGYKRSDPKERSEGLYTKAKTNKMMDKRLTPQIKSLINRMDITLEKVRQFMQSSSIFSDLSYIKDDLGTDINNYELLYYIRKGDVESHFKSRYDQIKKFIELNVDRITDDGLPGHVGKRLMELSYPIPYHKHNGISFDFLWSIWDQSEDTMGIDDGEDEEEVSEDPEVIGDDSILNIANNIFKAISINQDNLVNDIVRDVIINNIKGNDNYVPIDQLSAALSKLSRENRDNKTNNKIKNVVYNVIKTGNKIAGKTPSDEITSDSFKQLIDNIVAYEAWSALELLIKKDRFESPSLGAQNLLYSALMTENEKLILWVIDIIKQTPNVSTIDLKIPIDKNPSDESGLSKQNVMGSYNANRTFGISAITSLRKVGGNSPHKILTFARHNKSFLINVYYPDLLVNSDLVSENDFDQNSKPSDFNFDDKIGIDLLKHIHEKSAGTKSQYLNDIYTSIATKIYNNSVISGDKRVYLLRGEISDAKSKLKPKKVPGDIMEEIKDMIKHVITVGSTDATLSTTAISVINNNENAMNKMVIRNNQWIVGSSVTSQNYSAEVMNRRSIEMNNIFSQMLSISDQDTIKSEMRSAGLAGAVKHFNPAILKKSDTSADMDSLLKQLKSAYNDYEYHRENYRSDITKVKSDTETVVQKNANLLSNKFNFAAEFGDDYIKIYNRSNPGDEVVIITNGLNKEDLALETVSYIFNSSGFGKGPGKLSTINKEIFDVEDNKVLYLDYNELKLVSSGFISGSEFDVTDDNMVAVGDIKKYGPIIGAVSGKLSKKTYEIDIPRHELQKFVTNSNPSRITPDEKTSELPAFVDALDDNLRDEAIQMLNSGYSPEQVERKMLVKSGAISDD